MFTPTFAAELPTFTQGSGIGLYFLKQYHIDKVDQAHPLTNDIPVYIGPMNEYYRLFDTTYGSNHEHFGLERHWLNYHELKTWYEKKLSYM